MPKPEDSLELELLRGAAALTWLESEPNRRAWRTLNDACPWTTPFQTPEFAEVWSKHYSPRWEPLLVLCWHSDGLRGVLPLAIQGSAIVGMGSHQAEYPGPCCSEEWAGAILQAAWRRIAAEIPSAHLRLRYLAPELGATVNELVVALGSGRVIEHRRPLLRLDPAEIAQVLKKKGNRSKINRLEKLGALSFDILPADALKDEEFDQVVAMYDFRQGAVNDSCPFRDDPCKRSFHLDWFRRAPDHLQISRTRLDGTTIAALVGVRCGRKLSNAMIAYSPFLSRYSPGKFHLYWAAQAALESGFDKLDLTPGGDAWKERFADTNDTVYELELWADRSAARRARTVEAAKGIAKTGLSKAGITPEDARRVVAKLRTLGPSGVLQRLSRCLPRRIEYRVYGMRIEPGADEPLADEITVNDLAALVRFEPGEPWQTRQGVLGAALSRLERGEQLYTVADTQRLLHFGWLVPRQEEARFSEVNRLYRYPQPGAVLYDFYSHPSARGRGLYQRTIKRILIDLKRHAIESTWAYISVLSDNKPSRHVIEKLGFQHIDSLYVESGSKSDSSDAKRVTESDV